MTFLSVSLYYIFCYLLFLFPVSINLYLSLFSFLSVWTVLLNLYFVLLYFSRYTATSVSFLSFFPSVKDRQRSVQWNGIAEKPECPSAKINERPTKFKESNFRINSTKQIVLFSINFLYELIEVYFTCEILIFPSHLRKLEFELVTS